MCDTFVAVPPATKDGSVILGKNSDRQPNEPQEVLRISGSTSTTDTLKCTYIEIPQAAETYDIVVSKPNWMYGAEMGINEHGLAIGNEAVWTIFDSENRKEKLLGMDMLRVALERAKNANEALLIITDLIENFGQGGNCGFAKPEYYDNSFIIADTKEAWVLETAGEFWIAEKVNGIRSISNTLTIESNYDKIHPTLIDYAIGQGLCKDEDDFNFKAQFSAKYNINRIGAKGDTRIACTYNALRQNQGEITVKTAFDTLREHNTEENFNPRTSSMRSPCLHASSLLTPSQSTGSMVAHLTDTPIGWFTGTAAPCLSVFKPIRPDLEIDLKPLPRRYEPSHLWWDHERLHRYTLQNYEQLSKHYLPEAREMEEELVKKVANNQSDEAFRDLSAEAFSTHQEKISEWMKTVQSSDYDTSLFDFRYNRYWSKLNKKAGIKYN